MHALAFDRQYTSSMPAALESAKHLRVVHFTLTAACLALLLTAVLNENARLGRATEQLHTIKLILSKLPNDWHSRYAERLRVKYSKTLPSEVRALVLDTHPPDALSEVIALDPTGHAKLPYESSHATCWVDFQTTTEYETLSLATFEKIWNALNELTHVKRITRIVSVVGYPQRAPSSGFFCGSEPTPVTVRMRGKSAMVKEGEDSFVAMPLHYRIRTGFPYYELEKLTPVRSSRREQAWSEYPVLLNSDEHLFTQAYYNTARGSGYLPIQIGVETEDIQFQSPLAEVIDEARVNVPVGAFADVFRDLSVVTHNFRDVPLEQVGRIIDALREHVGADLELLGVKIPSQAIRFWGILVLLGIQVYFVLHLKQLAQLETRDDLMEAVWIAAYPSALPRTAAIFSGAILPTVTVFLITFRTPSGVWTSVDARAYLLTITATALSVISARLIWDVSRTRTPRLRPRLGRIGRRKRMM